MPVDEERGSERAHHRRGAEKQRPTRACRQRPTDGHAGEDGGVDDVVAPEIEDATEFGFLELQPRQLPVASIHDRVQQEQQRAHRLPGPVRREKEGRAEDADRRRDHADLRRLDGGRRKQARDPQRDRPVEVPRHEPVGVLDQPPQQAPFCHPQVFRRGHDHGVDPARDRRGRTELARQPPLDCGHIACAFARIQRGERAGHGYGRQHDDPMRQGCPGRGLDRRGCQPGEPLRLREDRDRGDDHRRRLQPVKQAGERAPACNRSRSRRRRVVACQKEDPRKARAPRRHERPLQQGQPKNMQVAVTPRRIGCVARRITRYEDQDRRGRQCDVRVLRLLLRLHRGASLSIGAAGEW